MPECSCRVTLRTANWEVSFENVAMIDFTSFSHCQNTTRIWDSLKVIVPEYSCRVTLRIANWEVSFENVARIDFTWFSYCQNTSAQARPKGKLKGTAVYKMTGCACNAGSRAGQGMSYQFSKLFSAPGHAPPRRRPSTAKARPTMRGVAHHQSMPCRPSATGTTEFWSWHS